jgi:hypothetical protein
MNDALLEDSLLHAERYAIHGVGLEVRSNSLPLMRRIDARLSPFNFRSSSPRDIDCSLAFEAVPDGEILGSIPDDAALACELHGGEALYSPSEDRLYCQVRDRIFGFIDAERGTALFQFRAETADLLNISHGMLTLCVQEMLKWRGYYPLHAACLSREGECALFAGDSGCGKSTLTVNLLQSDFDFMGDDTAFLSWRLSPTESERRCQAFAFPDQLDLSETTLQWFPRLSPESGSPDHPALKRSFSLTQVSERPLVLESAPRFLFFPRISEKERTTLVPMSKSEAFMELVPNVWMTNRAVMQAHLGILQELTRRCSCFRIETGHDFDRQAGLIAERFAAHG